MAEEQDDSEKTEDPTQKRLDDALKRGDVVKSQEVNTWFVIAGATLVLVAFSGSVAAGLPATLRGLIANAHQVSFDRGGLLRVLDKLGLDVIGALALPVVLLVLAAIGGNMIQHRLVWSTEPLKLQLSKISPLAGLKRLLSTQALANFGKGLVKLVVIGAVMMALLWPQRDRLEGLVQTDVLATLLLTRSLALDVLGAVVAILAFVAAADYLFQYRQWYERQKMSMRELKEEFKQTEGDPDRKSTRLNSSHSRASRMPSSA